MMYYSERQICFVLYYFFMDMIMCIALLNSFESTFKISTNNAVFP